MKNIIYLIVLAGLLLFSCTNEVEQVTIESATNSFDNQRVENLDTGIWDPQAKVIIYNQTGYTIHPHVEMNYIKYYDYDGVYVNTGFPVDPETDIAYFGIDIDGSEEVTEGQRISNLLEIPSVNIRSLGFVFRYISVIEIENLYSAAEPEMLNFIIYTKSPGGEGPIPHYAGNWQYVEVNGKDREFEIFLDEIYIYDLSQISHIDIEITYTALPN